MYVINREHAVNEEVPRDVVNTPIYNYVSSNYKPCSWNQLGEKFFKNEKIVSSTNFVTVECINIYIFPGAFPFWFIRMHTVNLPFDFCTDRSHESLPENTRIYYYFMGYLPDLKLSVL